MNNEKDKFNNEIQKLKTYVIILQDDLEASCKNNEILFNQNKILRRSLFKALNLTNGEQIEFNQIMRHGKELV